MNRDRNPPAVTGGQRLYRPGLIFTMAILLHWQPLQACLAESDSLRPVSGSAWPKPQRGGKLLFFVQRTHNRNTVVYELNPGPDGRPDPSEPLHARWIRYEEGGISKELSFIQNKVYGLHVERTGNDYIILKFKSYRERELYLIKSKRENRYMVMMRINGKMAELVSLFISSVTNKLGIPSKIRYIDITGIDPASGAVITERVVPD